MTREQWLRVEALFSEALHMSPESRHGWLGGIAAGDPEVLHEVQALVEAHEAAGSFLQGSVSFDPQDLLDTEDRESDATSRPDDSLPPGLRIGDYEIRREIGRGGMGVVYLAQDVQLTRLAAIKALPAVTARDKTLLARLQREAQAAAAISHPGVALVYAFIETPLGNFIASEFIHGHSLRHEMRQGPIAAARAVRIATDIVGALCAAHDAHVIHRDLKPENVLLTPGGAIKIIDFGIARIDGLDGPNLTMPGSIQGTPGYMAPEQLVPGAAVGGGADLYALGVILAEMIIGHHPFERAIDTVPESLQSIIRRCMETHPQRRYQSARDLLHDLERVSLTLSGSADVPFGPGGALRSQSALWWWQFHQGVAALMYWIMAVPAWYARELIGGVTGRMFFFATLGALILASTLRLHLWFSSRLNPAELVLQFRRERAWIMGADVMFAVSLIASGLVVGDARMSLAVLLIAVGIGSCVVSLFIEPTTARAAFEAFSR